MEKTTYGPKDLRAKTSRSIGSKEERETIDAYIGYQMDLRQLKETAAEEADKRARKAERARAKAERERDKERQERLAVEQSRAADLRAYIADVLYFRFNADREATSAALLDKNLDELTALCERARTCSSLDETNRQNF